MPLSQRSLIDCNPFGAIPINNSTPPFICALFGNDASSPDPALESSISSCCSPYYPAEYLAANGCDIHYCGLPAYEEMGTVTSTQVVVYYPTGSDSVRPTSTYTSTQTYDAIVGYPKVAQCLSSVALWDRAQHGFACRVGGALGSVSMTGPATITSDRPTGALPTVFGSGTARTTTIVHNSSGNKLNTGWVGVLLAVCWLVT